MWFPSSERGWPSCEPGAEQHNLTPSFTHHLTLCSRLVSGPSRLEGSKLGLQRVDVLRALLLQSQHLPLCTAALLVCGGLWGYQRIDIHRDNGGLILFLSDPKMGVLYKQLSFLTFSSLGAAGVPTCRLSVWPRPWSAPELASGMGLGAGGTALSSLTVLSAALYGGSSPWGGSITQ